MTIIGVGQQLIEVVGPTLAPPQVVVRIDDVPLRVDYALAYLV